MRTSESMSSNSHSLKVTITKRSFIQASNPPHTPYILPVSNLDLVPGRHPAALIFIHPKPPSSNSHSLITTIRTHLPHFLNHFLPFSGRSSTNPTTSRPEILCNNAGAELVEAEANVPITDIDFTSTKKSLETILVPPSTSDITLSLQVVRFTCGGFTLSWCSNHGIVDAYSLSRLCCSWAEFVRTKNIAKSPNYDRSIFQPGPPIRVNSSVDRSFATCTSDDLVNVLSGGLLHRGLYYVTSSDLARVQSLASQGGPEAGPRPRPSRTQAFSAHVWKVLAEVVGESDTACQMGWFVDGRRRIMGWALAENYIGNGHSVVVKEVSVKDLKGGLLSNVVEMVSDSIKEIDVDHFVDLVNWVEDHQKEFMLHRAQLGLGPPVMFISSCNRLPLDSDFGFGPALFGVFHSLGSDRFATAFMNIAGSPVGDGSWIVNAVLWPKLAKALQSDPVCALKPVTGEYLRRQLAARDDGGLISRL